MSNNNNNNYDGTYDSQFPTWWNGTATTNDNFTFTTSTDGITCGNILSYTANTTWDFYNNYDMWPRGVQDPSTEHKYAPKWHILLGYKNQLKIMWD